jgi:HPt (histidine-containing phosphotransfer) domain-containing protein
MQEQLRALVERHHANLAAQVAAAAGLLAELDENGAVPAARIIEAQGITHQLKGTAGSMGFAEVSAAAAALDESLKGLKKQPCPILATQLEASLEKLAALKRIAEQTTPEMSTLYNADLTKLAR